MDAAKQSRLFSWKRASLFKGLEDIQHFSRVMMTVLAGGFMVCASLLPWLNDPLGKSFIAWELPINTIWTSSFASVNYGLLCLFCAIFVFGVAYADWKTASTGQRDRDRDGAKKARNWYTYLATQQKSAGWLCLFPLALFLFQYLCIDIDGIAFLAANKVQALLIQGHLGYSLAAPRLALNPFLIDSSTLWERLQILVNQIAIGWFIPGISVLLLTGLCGKNSAKNNQNRPTQRVASRLLSKPAIRTGLAVFLLLLSGIVFGRAPAALLCENLAKTALSEGDYSVALQWLDRAQVFNPAFNRVAYFHRERGEALYYLYPNQQNKHQTHPTQAEYRKQGDYCVGCVWFLVVWHTHPETPWVVEEMSATLEHLSEFTQSAKGQPVQRSDNDDTALPWLQLLVQIDPKNVYGQYVIGRIEYELHDYAAANTQMMRVIQLSKNSDIQSSAYTYMALSAAGQGDYATSRKLLLKALALDPFYRNNTARQELSGLR